MIPAGQSIPVLLAPTAVGVLIIPSAMVAEVVVSEELAPIPGSQEWVLGFCMWRGAPVSVVSFEGLVGQSPIPSVRKLVVLFPLAGRGSHEYLAIATNAEPRTTHLGPDLKVGSRSSPPGSLVAASLELSGGVGLIPDFEALSAMFYPTSGG